jgi:heterodisulfide reductase subunit A-like polyferredoxin
VFPAETFLDDVYAFCRHLMTIPTEALGLAKLTVDIAADVQDRTVQRHVDRLVVTTTFEEFQRRATERFGFGKGKAAKATEGATDQGPEG